MCKKSVKKSISDVKLQCSCVYLEHIYLFIAVVRIFMLPKERAYDFH